MIVPRPREAAEAGHLPDLEVLARGLFQNAAGRVGANVEHQHFDGADGGFNLLDQGHHLFLLAGVRCKAVRCTAFRPDLFQQGLQLVQAAACRTGGITPTCEGPRNGAARGITRADDQCNFVHDYSL